MILITIAALLIVAVGAITATFMHKLVLEHGRLIQTGTHAELMEQDGHYRRAILIQSEGETA